MSARGWSIVFFERDVEWYRSNRDLPDPDFCDLRLYEDLPDLGSISADVILVGSLVHRGAELIDSLSSWDRPLFYYDIDTPITLSRLGAAGETDYLRADQIQRFETYFSFAGGPALDELEDVWQAKAAEALYCGVDPEVYRPTAADPRFECTVSYLGTHAADRQQAVEKMLFAPARALPSERFYLAGAQYPPMHLPPNVTHEIHVYQRDHAALYCSSRATLNLTRESMRRYGWSPSTRIFEAGACGACIISDNWPGLSTLFAPDRELLLAEDCSDVLRHLEELTDERRDAIGSALRDRVLSEHTYERRAAQMEAAFERVLVTPGVR
jgi:spore maturation protein CgeB